MNKQAGNRPSTLWKPGQSGNPLGRPQGARSKFSEQAVAELLEDWTAHGKDVLARVRMTDPAVYLRVAFSVIPKEIGVSIERPAPGNLDAESWATLRRLLDLISASGVEGDPQAVFGMIEDDLRARLATPIDTK